MFFLAEIHHFKAPKSESRTESGPTHLGAPDQRPAAGLCDGDMQVL